MPRVQVIEIDSEADALAQLAEVGASKPGQRLMSRKAVHRVLRIKSLGATALSILKQEMLSVGAEAGIPANAYYLKDEVGEALLMGTRAQYDRLIGKLRLQPRSLGLGVLAQDIATALLHYDEPSAEWRAGSHSLPLQRRPYIIGVVPFIPSRGIEQREEALTESARRLVQAGADIVELEIDNSAQFETLTSKERELLTPTIATIVRATGAIVAVATAEPSIAALAVRGGAEIIDETALTRHAGIASVAAQSKAGLIVRSVEVSAVAERIDSLSRMIAEAETNGVASQHIAIDPVCPNDACDASILSHLKEFRILGAPLVVTVPFSAQDRRVVSPEHNVAETAAWVAMSSTVGAHIVRVHNVVATERAIRSLFP